MSSMMAGGIPPELAQALMQQGGGPPQQGGAYDEQDQNPLDVLQQCIQALPGVISALPDPKDTQDAVKALLILTGIQTRMMQSGPPQGQ